MIALLLILVIVGFALFLFNRFMPLEGNVKSLINYLVIFYEAKSEQPLNNTITIN